MAAANCTTHSKETIKTAPRVPECDAATHTTHEFNNLVSRALDVRWVVVVSEQRSGDGTSSFDDSVLMKNQVDDVVGVVDNDDSSHNKHGVQETTETPRELVVATTAQRSGSRVLEHTRRATVSDWSSKHVVNAVEEERVSGTVDWRV